MFDNTGHFIRNRTALFSVSRVIDRHDDFFMSTSKKGSPWEGTKVRGGALKSTLVTFEQVKKWSHDFRKLCEAPFNPYQTCVIIRSWNGVRNWFQLLLKIRLKFNLLNTKMYRFCALLRTDFERHQQKVQKIPDKMQNLFPKSSFVAQNPFTLWNSIIKWQERGALNWKSVLMI